MAGLRLALSWPRAPLLSAIARWPLAAAFVAAGAIHAWNPAGFAAAIARYRILPQPAAAAAADYLPWLELAVGAGLATAALRRGALALAALLLAIFTSALLSARARGLDIACGCFGQGSPHFALDLARDLALLLAVGLALAAESASAGDATVLPRQD